MKITGKIQRPKFYDYALVTPQASRTCSHEGCNAAADKVQGFYLVAYRRVRVWVCSSHWQGDPLLALPTPPDILVALRKEQEFYDENAEQYRRNADPEHGVSVKVLASSGHGNPVPGDRVKSWRWGA